MLIKLSILICVSCSLVRSTGGPAKAEHSSEKGINNFMQWLTENGVDHSPCKIEHSKLGFGLHAQAKFDAGSMVLFVPEHLILSRVTARRSPIGHILEEFYKSMPYNDHGLVLASFMVYEMLKGGDSFWAPFFRLLPVPDNTLPYWRYACLSTSCLSCTVFQAPVCSSQDFVLPACFQRRGARIRIPLYTDGMGKGRDFNRR